jgi:hypothetical protein
LPGKPPEDSLGDEIFDGTDPVVLVKPGLFGIDPFRNTNKILRKPLIFGRKIDFMPFITLQIIPKAQIQR